MAKAKRNIGLEILEGIREIKRGEHSRVITVPAVSAVRESTGFSQSHFAELLGSRCGRCRIGNKVVEPPRALRARIAPHCGEESSSLA